MRRISIAPSVRIDAASHKGRQQARRNVDRDPCNGDLEGERLAHAGGEGRPAQNSVNIGRSWSGRMSVSWKGVNP